MDRLYLDPEPIQSTFQTPCKKPQESAMLHSFGVPVKFSFLQGASKNQGHPIHTQYGRIPKIGPSSRETLRFLLKAFYRLAGFEARFGSAKGCWNWTSAGAANCWNVGNRQASINTNISCGVFEVYTTITMLGTWDRNLGNC